jgi:D-tagatose-1,6-bisphosphate aldolase subunit GatZ/KbaZ
MYLDEIVAAQHRGEAKGIPSVCSAHPDVLREALRLASRFGMPALIESTCNQVNQFGGYTGLTPSRFAAWIRSLATEHAVPPDGLILGGDHLGPSVWQNESSRSAMYKAIDLVREYVLAGFTKIHLDCSMRLGEDPPMGPGPAQVAERAADLAAVAEECSHGNLRFVIGSEVPLPGGAIRDDEPAKITSVDTVRESVEFHRQAFHSRGLQSAWERVVAVVVQPGVEFGDDFVLDYDPRKAQPLSRFIETQSIVYEAHSTDYQSPESLGRLVRDHFAILKVGPALTFAFREAVFALAALENELLPVPERSNLPEVVDQAMLRDPQHWKKYYPGSAAEQAFKRQYSRSDRVRYYWGQPDVQAAFQRLMANLQSRQIPLQLWLQHGGKTAAALAERRAAFGPGAIISEHIAGRLLGYFEACHPEAGISKTGRSSPP